MIKIFRQLIEAEIFGNPVHAPGLCERLECPHQHLAGIFLVIHAFIRDTEHRQLPQAVDSLGDDVEMLAGMQGHIDAGHLPDVAGPHAGAIDNVIRGDRSFIAGIMAPGHTGYPIARLLDRRYLDAFDNRRAHPAGALCQCVGNVGRIALPVLRQIDRAGNVVDIEMRVLILDVGSGNLLDLNPEGSGHGRKPEDFLPSFLGQRNGNGAGALEAGCDTSLLFETVVEFLGVFRQPRHVLGLAQLGDQARSMPGGAAGQLLALQKHNVFPALFGQVIGHRAADDTTADDDSAGLLRK